MTPKPVTYECPIAGTEHQVISEDTRILKIGDGGFVIACNCGPESLDEVDEPPHKTVDHMVNVYAEDPTPEKWLELEGEADGWHDTHAWDIPEGFNGTNGQRRAQFRQKVEDIADTQDGRSLKMSAEQKQALKVECPNCGASQDSKCNRPSGHTVRNPHADRVEAAKEAGIIDSPSNNTTDQTEQADMTAFASS